MANIPSIYQKNIFSFVKDDSGNAVIEAVAGSGKTWTIVEALKMATGSTIFLAFNKAIQVELEKRGVNARTFHSLCYNVVAQFKKSRTAEPNKLRILIDNNLGDEDARTYGSFIVRLVGLARQAGMGCLIEESTQVWQSLIDHHDLELETENADLGRAIDLASKLLQASNASPMFDYDDMLYVAVKEGLVLPKFDFVFVDEAQDTNAIQRAILRKILKPTSRLIAVGDPAQAIYGFRGADSDSLDLIAEEFNCKRLPLTVSYRCPTEVVKYAKSWVSHIEAAPNAPAGSVTNVGGAWSYKSFAPNDLVVCRTTKPLISLAYMMLKNHVAVMIMGREIGAGFKSLINKMNAKGIARLIEKLDTYTSREVEKAIAKGQDAKAAAIRDKTDAILCLIEGLPETNRTIPALLEVLDKLFSDVKNAVVLATIHKAKSLEEKKVFWLNSSQCPSKWARQAWQLQQEKNLCYVAVTRAMQELVLIEEGSNGVK